MPERDVVVVGAGVIGCLIAREITQRAPRASVLLLERDTVGGGASRRSAGLHIPRGGTERVRRMTGYSQRYYSRLAGAAPEMPIHPVGMSVVTSAAGVPALSETYLDSARLRRTDREPPHSEVRLPEKVTVWRGNGCQYADVYGLTQALARRLRARAEIREGVRVTAVEPSAGAAAVTLGTGERITAGRVVLAPGPWLAAPAWRDLVAPLGARVKKVVALHIDRQPAIADRVVVFQDEDAFLLPLRDRGHWLFSHTCQDWDVDPDAPSAGLSESDLTAALDSLRRWAPALAERCGSGRVFCDAYSGTGEPRVRALDPDGRIVFAGAANGSGYRLAPAIAAEAADLLQLRRSYE